MLRKLRDGKRTYAPLAYGLALLGQAAAVFCLGSAWAKTTAEVDLRKIQHLAILEGDFDPPTLRDQTLAYEALSKGADAVLLLPRSTTDDLMALPLNLRLRLLEIQARDSSKILVPSAGKLRSLIEAYPYAIIDEIRNLNPVIRFEVEQIRTSNEDLIERIRAGSNTGNCPPEMLPSVCKEVFANGFYVGRDRNNRIHTLPPYLAAAKKAIVLTTNLMGLRQVRSKLVRKRKEQTPLEGRVALPGFSGGYVQILKRLGNGYFANAYLVEHNGRQMVLSQNPQGSAVSESSRQPD